MHAGIEAPMIRLILTALFLFWFLILFCPVHIVLWIMGKIDKDLMSRVSLRLVQWVLRVVFWLSGSTLTVTGRENIPDDQPVLYVGNHRSYFDIVVMYPNIKGQMGFIAKKEIGMVFPLIPWMNNIHCLFLDRDDLKKGFQMILDGVELIKSGVSICIYPEGHRNKGTGLLEFHNGSLKIAEKAKCPIIPVAITGTAEIYEKHRPFIRKSNVTLQFGEPIYTDSLDRESKKHLSETVQKAILDMLPEGY